MYNQSREVTFFLFASVALATALTGFVVWEQLFLITHDSWANTFRGILREIGGPVPAAILVIGNLEVGMVISRYIIEQYRKERYAAAIARGRQENDKKWRDWYNRMLEAQAKGEDFDEPPPGPDSSED